MENPFKIQKDALQAYCETLSLIENSEVEGDCIKFITVPLNAYQILPKSKVFTDNSDPMDLAVQRNTVLPPMVVDPDVTPFDLAQLIECRIPDSVDPQCEIALGTRVFVLYKSGICQETLLQLWDCDPDLKRVRDFRKTDLKYIDKDFNLLRTGNGFHMYAKYNYKKYDDKFRGFRARTIDQGWDNAIDDKCSWIRVSGNTKGQIELVDLSEEI